MTFRKSILAGLVAALALPVVTHASSSGPTKSDLELLPTAKNTQFAAPATNVKNTRIRTVDPKEVQADKAWTERHQKAMASGNADHMAASVAAGQR